MVSPDFKATLGLDKEAQVRLDKSEIINLIGNPDKIVSSGQDAVVYYKVRGGMVMMEVSTFEWNQERGRKYVFLRIDKLHYDGE